LLARPPQDNKLPVNNTISNQRKGDMGKPHFPVQWLRH
jgi:hypothetical protein